MSACTTPPPAATFNANEGVVTSLQFDPMNPGTTRLNLLTPAGFEMSQNFTNFVVTVTAPALSLARHLAIRARRRSRSWLRSGRYRSLRSASPCCGPIP
jgi:hypothetical protein